MLQPVASLASAAALVAALFCASGADAAGGAALTPPIAAITPAFFGMHTENPATLWPAVPFGSLAKGNCVQWATIQPQSGSQYSWTPLDKYATAAATHGTTFTYAPGTLAIPEWATSDTTTCIANPCGGTSECGAPPSTTGNAAFKAFFTALAARYCTNMSFELWNEPWDTGGPTAAQLVAETIDEETAIRAGCPNAFILSPSFSGDDSTGHLTYIDNYYADGGPTDVNAVSLHIYTDGAAPIDYPESINPNTGHGVDYGNAIPTIDQYLPNKQIWMTEGSWGKMTDSQDFETAATQAGYIARYYLIQWSLGFRRVLWYEYDNPTFGTLNPSSRSDGSSVPQIAYTQTYDWLVGRQMTTPCSTPTPTASAAVYTCGISGAGGYRGLAAWITSGSQSYTPPNPSSYTQYRDLTGAVHAYAGGAVTITTSPILFEN